MPAGPIEHIERLRGKRAAQKDSSGLHIVAGFPTQSDRLFVHILRQDGSWDFLNFASKDAPWQSIDGELRISWIVPTPETLKLKPPIENPSWVLCLNGSACLHSAGSVYYVCTDAHTLGWMFEL